MAWEDEPTRLRAIDLPGIVEVRRVRQQFKPKSTLLLVNLTQLCVDFGEVEPVCFCFHFKSKTRFRLFPFRPCFLGFFETRDIAGRQLGRLSTGSGAMRGRLKKKKRSTRIASSRKQILQISAKNCKILTKFCKILAN